MYDDIKYIMRYIILISNNVCGEKYGLLENYFCSFVGIANLDKLGTFKK